MSRYEHGRILAVNEVKLGSELVADHAAAVTALTVDDPVDFDEDGGSLVINSQVIAYSTFDDDTGTITLSTPLAVAASEGDRVNVYDTLYQLASTEKIAQVELDGDDDNTDPIEATIAHHLVDKLGEGIRGLTGESVLLELDGDEWRIVDILGLSTSAGTKFWQDTFTLAVGGAQSLTLTYEPLAKSEHLYWGGLYQGETVVWTRSGKTVSILGPEAKIGDVITVEYAYLESPSEMVVLTPYQSSGWRSKQITVADNTDYSAAAYNDAAWTVAAAAFGDGTNVPANQPWPETTMWPVMTRLWLRRSDIPAANGYLLRILGDDEFQIYWNGNYVGGFTNGVATPLAVNEFSIPAAFVVPGLQQVSIRATDNDSAAGNSFVDVEISGRRPR